MASTEVADSHESSLILKLPPEILEKTLSFLSFEEICSSRLVCKMLDKTGQQILNQGFSNAEKFHSLIYKEIKAKLPRRESERRNHSLARHMDLLAALETRLSLLAMTYIKYMEMGMCCFIPGKVLDEIYRILYRIRNDPTPPRPHELLTELRDISSMAMEHFEEKMVPILRGRIRTEEAEMGNSGPEFNGGTSTDQQYAATGYKLPDAATSPVMNTRVPPLRVELVQLRNTMRSTSSTVVALRKEANDYKSIIADQHKKMLEYDKKILYMNRSMNEMKKRLSDQEKMLCDVQNSLLRLERKSNPGEDLEKTQKSLAVCDGELNEKCDVQKSIGSGGWDPEHLEEPSTSQEHLVYGNVPSPDSIDPELADLRTLLTVLDAEPPPPMQMRIKRKRPDDQDETSSKMFAANR